MAPRGRRLCQAPSDLTLAPERYQGLGVRVAGRVLASQGATLLTLADALASIQAELSEPLGANAGDLLELEGVWSEGRLERARLLSHQPAPTSRGDGEFARLSWQGLGARLVSRAAALSSIRQYFEEEGFVEVNTPVRVRTPGLDANVNALAQQDEFLRTSPELHMKRLLVGGLPRIFQLGPCFRAEELGALHEPEFSMLEWYRAFADYEAVLEDTEALVLRVVQALTGTHSIHYQGHSVDVTPPFLRLSVCAAFRAYAGIDDARALAERDEARFFELLVGEVEPALARLPKPVFLTEYPASQAALARPLPGDPTLAERFELYVAGVELCNGFSELTDPVEQRRRFEMERSSRRSSGAPVYAVDERFLAALEEGMPCAAGNALGFDRLLMLALGSTSIGEVLAFSDALK